jgi:hypothetical protein
VKFFPLTSSFQPCRPRNKQATLAAVGLTQGTSMTEQASPLEKELPAQIDRWRWGAFLLNWIGARPDLVRPACRRELL